LFFCLLCSDPHDAASRFTERVPETLLGVGVAYASGLRVPALTDEYGDRVIPARI
jgi:hypothetical protein